MIVAIQRRSGVMLGVTRVSSLGTAARCLEKSGGDPLRPALAGLAIATRGNLDFSSGVYIGEGPGQ
ncbi:MAG TPA: hypothetical protein VME67_06440 [Mycobacterium sp.]|nr:hypothetical protein [Mycobacterium sp.]HTX94503.1 hypothetical protein [Mycobacterium sp.]